MTLTSIFHRLAVPGRDGGVALVGAWLCRSGATQRPSVVSGGYQFHGPGVVRGSRGSAVVSLLVACALISGCEVLGPVYGDQEGGGITVRNECSVALEVVVSQSEPPPSDYANPGLVRAGEYMSSGSLQSSGNFYVLAIGPSGGEYRTRVSFDTDNPEAEVVIAGSDCPD